MLRRPRLREEVSYHLIEVYRSLSLSTVITSYPHHIHNDGTGLGHLPEQSKRFEIPYLEWIRLEGEGHVATESW